MQIDETKLRPCDCESFYCQSLPHSLRTPTCNNFYGSNWFSTSWILTNSQSLTCIHGTGWEKFSIKSMQFVSFTSMCARVLKTKSLSLVSSSTSSLRGRGAAVLMMCKLKDFRYSFTLTIGAALCLRQVEMFAERALEQRMNSKERFIIEKFTLMTMSFDMKSIFDLDSTLSLQWEKILSCKCHKKLLKDQKLYINK